MSAGPSTTSAGPFIASAASTTAARPDEEPTDSEGTPNYLQKFLTALKRENKRDELVDEYMSLVQSLRILSNYSSA